MNLCNAVLKKKKKEKKKGLLLANNQFFPFWKIVKDELRQNSSTTYGAVPGWTHMN